MGNSLEKRYGLATAISMVVGIVIGSGVFFKAEKILMATEGNLPLGILAWILGGCIMIVCAYTFSVLATKYEKVNGIVDYAEAIVGPGYGYFVGWFLAAIYYPSLTGILAWVSARYTCVLFGWSIVGPEALAITMFYLVALFAINAIAPVISGKIQVSTTVIKMIPLYLMAIIGTVAGLSNGMLVENFTYAAPTASMGTGAALLTAVVATSFAYEGWIIATSINAELKDAKKNLPRALVIGTALIMLTYILYYVGLAGTVPNEIVMSSGEEGAKIAFQTLLHSKVAGTVLSVLIVISCLGTTNGLMVACTRGFYALAARNEGPAAKVLGRVDGVTNMPTNASIVGVLMAAAWMLYFFGGNLVEKPWFGAFSFDMSELPIVTIYALYLPLFFLIIKKETKFKFTQRYLGPILSIIGSLFMVYASYVSHGNKVFTYLIVFAVIMAIGMVFRKSSTRHNN